MLVVLEIEKLDNKAFMDMEENKEITISGKGVSIYFKDDYIQELEEKAKKYDDYLEKKEEMREEYERLEKEAEPLREQMKKDKKSWIKLMDHLDEMIRKAKKTPELKSKEEFSNDLEGGYLGVKIKPRTNF